MLIRPWLDHNFGCLFQVLRSSRLPLVPRREPERDGRESLEGRPVSKRTMEPFRESLRENMPPPLPLVPPVEVPTTTVEVSDKSSDKLVPSNLRDSDVLRRPYRFLLGVRRANATGYPNLDLYFCRALCLRQPPQIPPPKPPVPVSSITSQTPENVIGETLVVQGRVEFQNLLRIDGHFEVCSWILTG